MDRCEQAVGYHKKGFNCCQSVLAAILGMIPLVNDDMFGALAVTIMGGLFIGTIITLVILPILYSLFFRIRPAKHGEEEQQQQQQIRINWR